jgi:hypothetical protein
MRLLTIVPFIGIPLIALTMQSCGMSSIEEMTNQLAPLETSSQEMKRVLCESYCPVKFDDRSDSYQTVKQIRKNNAVWKGHGCKEIVSETYLQECWK